MPMRTVHEPPRWALISHVTTTTAVVANHQRAHAVPAHVANLVTGAADNIPVSTSTSSSTPTSASTSTSTVVATTTPFSQHISLGALPGYMTRDVAQVANRVIWAVTSQVPSLPTVVAGLLIGTINSDVPLLVAVVAESRVTGRQLGSFAVLCMVASLATGMADALIGALAGQVARLLAVPAKGFRGAFSCNMPRKSTVVADGDIGAISNIMSWPLAVLAQIRSP